MANDSPAIASSARPPSPALQKAISTRAFSLLALGGSIGAGLLIASGQALQRGGPGAVVVAFVANGIAVWNTMAALGELSASFPVQGSFYDYSVRFISPSWGFAMGWNYVLNFLAIVPFEITVTTMIAMLWVPAGAGVLGSGVLAVVGASLVLLSAINYFGARGYSETENVFGVMKVLVLTVFIVTGCVIAGGGTSEAGGRGFDNWKDGQAFRNGIAGFLSVFTAAGMAYGGTEMLGLTVAECKNPRRVMPLGALIVVVRILFCYILSLFVLGLVVRPADFARPEFAGLHVVSPFVVAVRAAGIRFLPDVINAFLMLAVFSMANASVYASSRALTAICAQGMGPRVFARLTPRGLPRNSLLVVFVVAQLAWVVAAPKGALIFDWLLSLASVSNYFTWCSICVSHIRLRKAMRRQGRSVGQLEWRAPLGVYGSYLAIALILVSMGAQVASAILPPVLATDMPRAQTLLMGILGFIVVAVFWLGHLLLLAPRSRAWRERLLVPVDSIALPELDVGDAAAVEGAERELVVLTSSNVSTAKTSREA